MELLLLLKKSSLLFNFGDLVERKSYYLIILLVALFVCAGVFYFQFNNDVPTFIIMNETEVSENTSFSGMLMDGYGYGVSNQTVTYNEPGSNNKIVSISTDENGEFTIENVHVADDSNNYYGNFTFAGDGKYQGCTYEGKITVVSD